METITARNQTHDFEIFCRKLCERTIGPTLKPATGPEGGGDSKADTETIPIADEIGVLTYVDILRHTFCSHLAMRGAPARAIQELAGHQDLGTTQRYMHLSPAGFDIAIRLLKTGTETTLVAVEK